MCAFVGRAIAASSTAAALASAAFGQAPAFAVSLRRDFDHAQLQKHQHESDVHEVGLPLVYGRERCLARQQQRGGSGVHAQLLPVPWAEHRHASKHLQTRPRQREAHVVCSERMHQQAP